MVLKFYRGINVVVTCVLLVTLFTACKKSSPQYTSLETLAQEVITLINTGDAKKLFNVTVQEHEFIHIYYPYFPETKQDSRLSGEDFYRNFIGLEKKAAIVKKIKRYKGRIVSLKSIGEPEKIIHTEKFDVYRKIPVTFTIKDQDGKLIDITDNEILGAVVYHDNAYKLLNIFD